VNKKMSFILMAILMMTSLAHATASKIVQLTNTGGEYVTSVSLNALMGYFNYCNNNSGNCDIYNYDPLQDHNSLAISGLKAGVILTPGVFSHPVEAIGSFDTNGFIMETYNGGNPQLCYVDNNYTGALFTQSCVNIGPQGAVLKAFHVVGSTLIWGARVTPNGDYVAALPLSTFATYINKGVVPSSAVTFLGVAGLYSFTAGIIGNDTVVVVSENNDTFIRVFKNGQFTYSSYSLIPSNVMANSQMSLDTNTETLVWQFLNSQNIVTCNISTPYSCVPKTLVSSSSPSTKLIASEGRVGWIDIKGFHIYDTNTKQYLQNNLPSVTDFDMVNGEVLFNYTGHLYYQDLDNIKPRHIGIRVLDLENSLSLPNATLLNVAS